MLRRLMSVPVAVGIEDPVTGYVCGCTSAPAAGRSGAVVDGPKEEFHGR
jgi:hypothetical protein